MSKQAAIYARVSTDEQAKGYSLTTQVEACQSFAVERGYFVLEIFKDDYSGASLDRPALNKLREQIARQEINVVIVYDIDRLARKSVYQMLIEEEFKRDGVTIEYVLGQYDDTDEGRLQKQIRASIAEYEKAKILERSKRGKRGKASSGFVLVGARPPYGYTVRSEPHKAWLEVDEDEAKIVRLVYYWYLHGDGQTKPMSMLGIATRLTQMGIPTRGDKVAHVAKKRPRAIWSGGMIKHILSNEAYTGTWHFGKTRMISDGKEASRKAKPKRGFGKQVARAKEEWIPVTIPAIINPDMLEEAKERMKKNVEFSKKCVRNEYLMARRLRCARCGYTYVGRTRKDIHHYYYCKGREQRPMSLCDMPYFRGGDVDNTVWGWVSDILENPKNLAEGLRGIQEETRQANSSIYERYDIIQSQLEDSERQLQKLLDLYLSGDFPKEMLMERRTRLEDTIANLKTEQSQLASHLQSVTYSDQDIADIEAFCAKIRERLDMVTFDGKWRILELLDVRGTLAIENDERVIYVSCLVSPQPVSLVLTSLSLNIGEITTTPCASPPTARSR